MTAITKAGAVLLTIQLLLTLCTALDSAASLPESPVLQARKYPASIRHHSDKAHGIIMGLTVVVIFPLGGMVWKLLDRVCSSRTVLRVHVGLQLFGLAMLVAGFGIGVWVAITHAEIYNDQFGHAILGTIVTALFILQPLIGTLHHQRYRNGASGVGLRRVHVWLGRILIILGMVNGGTGLQLGANSPGGEKVYGILAGIIGVMYIALVVFWMFKGLGTSKEESSDEGEDVQVADSRIEKGGR